MSNMAHCVFTNTLKDLEQAEEVLNDPSKMKDLSDFEEEAKDGLLRLCAEIAEDWGIEL